MVISFAVGILLILVVLGLNKIRKKGLQYWLVSDIRRGIARASRRKNRGCIHIMFCFVDHFEPGNLGVDLETQRSRVREWVKRYPVIAMKHKDSDGLYPQHTFFFPPHYDSDDHLREIVDLCAKGFGEVEMHLHHDRQKPWPDDEASLRGKILSCIEEFSRYGVFCLPSGERTFAFIHGDWALANSLNGGAHCGVNDEISILIETGCYADFTFPVSNEAQPRFANTIFYARSERGEPKGYNKKAWPVAVSGSQEKGLMLIQGVIGLRWNSRTHRLTPSIEQSNIDKSDFPFEKRIDFWIRKGIHVQGRPEWIFVKIHTHGAREVDWGTLLGEPCDKMFTYLESRYNDGEKFCLHYVSAREMYNIIKAAEDGKKENPREYRNYKIPRYVYLK